MWSLVRKLFNRRKSSEPSPRYGQGSSDSSQSLVNSFNNDSGVPSRSVTFNNHRLDMIELSSQEDDNDSYLGTLASTVESRGDQEEEDLIEMKEEDRERRQNIIDTLIDFGVVGVEEGRQISDTPYVRICTGSPRCKAFVLVNNFLRFPSYINLSRCFTDYLNYRCQNGEILAKLLARKVCMQDEDDILQDQVSEDKEPSYEEKSVFDLLRKDEVFYSFCHGKVVNFEDVDHCSQCHVCFEHSFWSCKKCGTSTARLCQLCNPSGSELTCELCRQPLDQCVDKDEVDSSLPQDSSSSFDSLKSISQLDIEDVEDENASDNCSCCEEIRHSHLWSAEEKESVYHQDDNDIRASQCYQDDEVRHALCGTWSSLSE